MFLNKNHPSIHNRQLYFQINSQKKNFPKIFELFLRVLWARKDPQDYMFLTLETSGKGLALYSTR